MVVAEHGNIVQQKDGSQVVTLDKGTRFEGTALLRDFRITDFTDYKAVIGHRTVAADNTESEQMSMQTLWESDDPDARAEFHWRLTLVVSVALMALLVVPLSVVNPRQGRVLSMLPAILLYLIFFWCRPRCAPTPARANWIRCCGCGWLTAFTSRSRWR